MTRDTMVAGRSPARGEGHDAVRRRAAAGLAVAAIVGLLGAERLGAQGFGGFGQAVGGIAIDASGIVAALDGRALESLADERRTALAAGVGPVGRGAFRKVSLRAIVAAVDESVQEGRRLSPEVLFLGGLERVTHLFVDDRGHDIVLAGPADEPAVDPAGTIVGAASGRPLLQLEDLIVALRAIDAARAGGMRCSIDPTPEGIARLERFLSGQRQMGADPQAVFRGMEQAVGPQVVSVGGVPGDSRFATVLVAADFRMKRIGMGLEPSGIRELPSYLSLVPPGGKAATLPRFWLEAEYDPIARDPDELAWRLSGRRMKCLTESDALAGGAVQRGAGPADRVAQRWCAAMTAHYDALAKRQPVFAELVNVVDLAVVAALVRGRQLDARAGLDLSPLLDSDRVVLPSYEAAEAVPTVANGLKKGSVWLLSASGGVQFQPWEFASRLEEADDMALVRRDALAARPDAGGRSWD